MKTREKINKWPLIGNSHITDYLERSIKRDNVAGSYIFNGPDNLGKTTVARFFAQSLLCTGGVGREGCPCGQCPACLQFKAETKGKTPEGDEKQDTHGDFHLIKREKDRKNISIEQIREFIKTLNMSSFLGGFKIGIIKHAESLSSKAANALLKTLEEPKAKVTIILITHDKEALPITIISRSKVLEFRPVNTDIIYDYLVVEKKATRSRAKNFSRLSLGRPALAVKFFENRVFFDYYLDQVKMFLNFFNSDINSRLEALNRLFDGKTNREEQQKSVRRTLQVWQGIVRDWMLLEYGLQNIIQHEIVEEDLRMVKDRLTPKSIININSILKQADSYLYSNINPKLVLEKVVVSI